MRDHHAMTTESRGQRASESGTDQTADTGCGESKTVLPKREPEIADQQYGQWWLGRQDQP
jgi:hypothetical protein